MEPVVYCWGCGKLILIPFTQENKPAELFKCGWCEGVNSLQQQPFADPPHVQQQQQQLSQPPWRGGTQDQPHSQEHHVLVQQQQPLSQQHGYWQQQRPADYYSQQQQKWQQEQDWQPHVWQATNAPPAHAAATCHSPRRRCSWRACWGSVVSAWRWLVVALVVVLVGSISWCGIILLLPLVCTTWPTYLPNLSFGLLLVVQICFNYAAAVLQPAGRVSDHVSLPPRTPQGSVAQGSLQHWSWCHHCQAPKPLQAHHCRSCATCVVKMDHHCPFINNCVGAGNLRAFLLFLLWTLLAAAYSLTMCSLLVWQQWAVVTASVAAGRGSVQGPPHPNMWQTPVFIADAAKPGLKGAGLSAAAAVASGRTSNSSAGVTAAAAPLASSSSSVDLWLIATTGIFFLVLQASPWWLLAAYYLVAVSLGVMVALGMLLGSQLYYLAKGVAYIDHLKGRPAEHDAQDLQTGQDHDRQAAVKLGCCSRWLGLAQLTWTRWWEVLSAHQPQQQLTAGSMLQAMLIPRWHLPKAPGNKKWS